MERITNMEELRASILLHEIKQANEAQLLKEQAKITAENLKPVNLVKNIISDITGAPNFKQNLLDTTIGIAAGYLTKKVAVGSTHNPLKRLLGNLLQVGVTTLVTKNAEGIKGTAKNLINTIFKKKETAD